jgi:hypothetical protein
MSSTLKGRFVWHDLMTTDPGAAQSFYGGVVGWGTQPWQQDGSYTLWMAGEMPVGGCMALPAEVKAAAAVPPHWLTYVGTQDVDATAAQAASLGGKVLKAPEDIPSVGRFAVLADPQGAVLCVYAPAPNLPPPSGTPSVGRFSWHELATTDPSAAFAFYGALFAWRKATEYDLGPAGTYQLFDLGGPPLGGIYAKPSHVPVSSWLPYAMVSSADAAAAEATKLGGTIIVPPMDVPGGDRIAVGMDPQGAVFAVHARKG